MKQKYLIALAAIGSIALLAASCNSQTAQNQSNNSATASTTDCNNQKSAIIKKMQDKDASLAAEGNSAKTSLVEVFYSPKVQSCVYIETVETTIVNKPSVKTYQLVNAPNYLVIFGTPVVSGKADTQTKIDDFNIKVQAYR